MAEQKIVVTDLMMEVAKYAFLINPKRESEFFSVCDDRIKQALEAVFDMVNNSKPEEVHIDTEGNRITPPPFERVSAVKPVPKKTLLEYIETHPARNNRMLIVSDLAYISEYFEYLERLK